MDLQSIYYTIWEWLFLHCKAEHLYSITPLKSIFHWWKKFCKRVAGYFYLLRGNY